MVHPIPSQPDRPALNRRHVHSSWSLLSLLNLKLDVLPFSKRLEPIIRDCREMNEDVFAAVCGCDEAEAFGFVEPFYLAFDLSHDRE